MSATVLLMLLFSTYKKEAWRQILHIMAIQSCCIFAHLIKAVYFQGCESHLLFFMLFTLGLCSITAIYSYYHLYIH